jgi:hypothetical protein
MLPNFAKLASSRVAAEAARQSAPSHPQGIEAKRLALQPLFAVRATGAAEIQPDFREVRASGPSSSNTRSGPAVKAARQGRAKRAAKRRPHMEVALSRG